MTDLNNHKIKVLLIILLFLISYFLIFPDLYLGNGNEKLLWSRFFNLGEYSIFDRIYQEEVYPIYHTTLYIHIISALERLFGFNIYIIKIFVLTIKLITIYLIWFLYFKKEIYKFFLLTFIWISTPFIFFGEHYFEVDGHISYLLVLIFFYNYDLENNIKNVIIRISLLVICFYLKETLFIILSLGIVINSLFFRKEIAINLATILISLTVVIITFIFYCISIQIPLEILFQWTIYRFDFLIPTIIVDENIINVNYFDILKKQIKSILFASKGLIKFSYINFYILITYLLFINRNYFFLDKKLTFGTILFIISLIVVLITGSYSPRYQIAFVLPLLIILFFKTDLKTFNNKNRNDFEFVLTILIISLIIYFFIGNIIDSSKDILSNFSILKILYLLSPIFFSSSIFVYRFFFKEKSLVINIEYIIVINILLNIFVVMDNKSDYLNNPGTIIDINDIVSINEKYKDYKKITNSIDINPYLDDFNLIHILKGYPSIIPGIPTNELKIMTSEIEEYNLLNNDKCVGIFRCAYESKFFNNYFNDKDKVIYIENKKLNNNKNKKFIEEFNFKIVDNYGTFSIYEKN